MQANGYTNIEPTEEAEQEWEAQVRSTYEGLLMAKTRSWFTGFNSNVEGRDNLRFLLYNGGAPKYRRTCEEIAADGYRGFVLT